MGRAKAIVQLVTKHGGEVVELNKMETSWVLRPVAPSSASVEWSEQWYCKEGGECVDEKDLEYGFPPSNDDQLMMSEEIKRVARETDLSHTTFSPNWADQKCRSVVPCAGTDMYK